MAIISKHRRFQIYEFEKKIINVEATFWFTRLLIDKNSYDKVYYITIYSKKKVILRIPFLIQSETGKPEHEGYSYKISIPKNTYINIDNMFSQPINNINYINYAPDNLFILYKKPDGSGKLTVSETLTQRSIFNDI